MSCPCHHVLSMQCRICVCATQGMSLLDTMEDALNCVIRLGGWKGDELVEDHITWDGDEWVEAMSQIYCLIKFETSCCWPPSELCCFTLLAWFQKNLLKQLWMCKLLRRIFVDNNLYQYACLQCISFWKFQYIFLQLSYFHILVPPSIQNSVASQV